MDNKKKKKNKQNNKPDSNTNKSTTAEKEPTEHIEEKTEPVKTFKDTEQKTEGKTVEKQQKSEKPEKPAVKQSDVDLSSEHKISESKISEQRKETIMNAAKILLPIAACAIVIAVIISYAGSRKSQAVDNLSLNTANSADTTSLAALSDEPLAENAYASVNELMQSFCTAMADGDMDTVKAIKDHNTDKEIITYQEKSAFIERYDNINCYTKPGIENNTYFVYVTYDVKFKDIETEAPGLNAFYVYTAEDGSLKIDGDTEENIKAAFKLVTNQDDVVDLYNRINVSYTEAIASDEALNQFMEELPTTIRTSVGVALAQLETQNESGETPQTETDSGQTGETQTAEVQDENGEQLQNQVVNQTVRTTDTVNVRSSDSEEADKIGKAQAGMELHRIEERINGWSKVIFEDKEAYIKSDYLEVVATEAAPQPQPQPAGTTITATTNVNVRNQPSQESDKIGTAQAGISYNLVENLGEWYKIDYNGTTGYVKAEFFAK